MKLGPNQHALMKIQIVAKDSMLPSILVKVTTIIKSCLSFQRNHHLSLLPESYHIYFERETILIHVL